MKLKITNFGPVRGEQDYEIDLQKNFTLVTGGNGLGKTYLGYIVYGIVKRLSSRIKFVKPIFLDKDQIEKLFKEKRIKIKLSEEKFKWFIEEAIARYLKKIGMIWGIEKELSDIIFKAIKIDFSDINWLYKQFIEEAEEYSILNDYFVDFRKRRNSSTITITISDTDQTIDTDEIEEGLSYFIFMQFQVATEVIFQPTERNSIYTFSKELYFNRFEVINKLQDSFLEDNADISISKSIKRQTNNYPEVIKDSIKVSQKMSQLKKELAPIQFRQLADEIEKGILNGKVFINSEGEVEFSPNGAEQSHVPVHLSASFIKTISSVIFFLRHQAQKGSMLMIDEPAINLHPDMQIAFIRILARISNAGVKIWMSTHSDYIISEFNNLCLAGTLIEKGKTEEVKKWGYSTDLYLDKKNIQALYFDGKQADVKIHNLEVKDDGVDIESIDSCLDKLNERTNELYDLFDNLD